MDSGDDAITPLQDQAMVGPLRWVTRIASLRLNYGIKSKSFKPEMGFCLGFLNINEAKNICFLCLESTYSLSRTPTLTKIKIKKIVKLIIYFFSTALAEVITMKNREIVFCLNFYFS